MDVRYRCTADDFIEAQRFSANKSVSYRICLIAAAIFALLALYEVIFIDIIQAIPVGLLAVVFVLPKLFLPLRAMRVFKKHPNLARDYSLQADSEGLQIKSEVMQTNAKWTAYLWFRETPNLFLIYPGSQMFMMVPKRAFSPTHLGEFRELLLTHLNDPSL